MEFIDNHPVVSHRVRFRNRVEITEDEATHVRDGNVVVWLVKTHCSAPQYHATGRDSDERYRLTVQDVEEAQPLTGPARDAALLQLNRGQMPLWENPAVLDAVLGEPPEEPAALALTRGDNQDDNELAALRSYLDEAGELHEGERLVNAVRRLLERPAAALPVYEVGREEPVAFVPSIPLERDDVEIVGSLYCNGRSSSLQNLLDEHFGGS